MSINSGANHSNKQNSLMSI